jgi:hypothetical protein
LLHQVVIPECLGEGVGLLVHVLSVRACPDRAERQSNATEVISRVHEDG